MYWNKADYVDELNRVLKAKADHKALNYYKVDDSEYMTLADIIGHIWYFDITGYDEARILQTVASVIAGISPHNLITDTARLMSIAKTIKA